jgi:hypothetical protein
MYTNGQISSSLFAVFTPKTGNGHVQIGSYDSATYPTLQWFPTISTMSNWSIQLNSINSIAANVGAFMIVDTGTNSFYLPALFNTQEFLNTFSSTGKTCFVDGSGYIACPCDIVSEIKPLVMNFQSTTGPVSLTMSSANLGVIHSGSSCVTTMKFSPGNLLGGPWIQNFYVVFDYGTDAAQGRVGIAPYPWS